MEYCELTLGFINAAIEDARFNHMDSDENDGIPEDAELSDFDKDSLNAMADICAKFGYRAKSEIDELLNHNGWDLDQIGHYFYMNRVGHGVGFWDRDLGDLGDKLSELSGHGEVHLYVGDDGKFYAYAY